MVTIRAWNAGSGDNVEALAGTLLRNPTAQMLADGSYVVFWEDQGPQRLGTTIDVIRGQRFNDRGEEIGGTITVAVSGFNIRNPEVVPLADGGYMVAYDRVFSVDGGNNDVDIDIQAQRFTAEGTPVGGIISIDNGTGVEFDAAVARTSNQVVFAWRDADLNGGDIEVARFNTSTGGLTTPTVINSFTAGDQHFPEVAIDPTTGRYLVVWRSNDNASIGARLFESDGTPLVQSIAGTWTGFLNAPTVTGLKGGGFVVTWQESNGAGFDIKAQRLNANGQLVGGEFTVDLGNGQLSLIPDIVALADGGFAVTWIEFASFGNPGGATLKLKTFNANGVATSTEFTVNTTPIDFNTGSTPVQHQRQVWDVEVLQDGRLLVSWESDVSGTNTQYHVFTRIIDPRDGQFDGTALNERIFGNTIGDDLDGFFGNDRLFGLDGNDILRGGAGNDVLFGGTGVDTLRGGLGRHVLWGEGQGDKFTWRATTESARGGARDIVNDFRKGDKIVLAEIDAVSGPGNQAFRFIGEQNFNGTAGQVRYQDLAGKKVIVQGDVNGDGRADFEIMVVGLENLVRTDFIL
ncbi:MAG: hypothetical protein NW205_01545 [Hyphomicrobiaceae bacterium]|nr:hypothetical protein [Hyphomicrobiaceae bacterium]